MVCDLYLYNMDKSIKCRTCMENCRDRFYRITSYIRHFKTTCKDIIILLMPKMVNRLKDDVDVICFNCYKTIYACVKFIQKCLEVEIDLNSKEDILENKSRIETVDPQLDVVEKTENEEVIRDASESKNIDKKPIEFDEISELERDVSLHDHIISVKQPNTDAIHNFIGNLTSNGIRFLHCSFMPEQKLLKKRILFLGTACTNQMLDCKQCGNKSRNIKAAKKHAAYHKLREGKTTRRKQSLSEKDKVQLTLIAAESDTDTGKQNRFKCKRCHEYCTTKEELNKHLMKHTLYRCEQCNKGFPLKESLRSHKYTHNPKNSYICVVCGRGYAQSSTLRQHMFTHEKRPLLCSKCPKVFGHKLSLNRHMKKIHEKPNPVQCKECGKNIKHASLLSCHYRLMHLKDGKFKCDICGELFVRKDYLKRHINNHYGDGRRRFAVKSARKGIKGVKDKVTKNFKCKVCGKMFREVANLKSHLFVHSSLKPYKCDSCGLSFNTKTSKWRHEKLHKKNRNVTKCPICWRICESQEDLSEHVSKHPTPYQCDSCGMSFGRKYLLTHHISEAHVVAENESLHYQCILEQSLQQSEIEDNLPVN